MAGASPAYAQASGWIGANIGGATPSGRSTYGGGFFTVEGGGTRIYSTSDQFYYLYGQVTGDTSIIARVLAMENTNSWAKGGLMIRETLAAGSKHALVALTPREGVVFDRRTARGGTTAQTRVAGIAGPVWLRLVRIGSTLTASRSYNGTSWTTIGSATVSMTSTVYIGLAVSSYNSAALATASYSAVTVAGRAQSLGIVPISVADPTTSPTSPQNTPPTVSLTSPANGAAYMAPAAISVAASASDANGSVARVDFYAGSLLIGSDTTSPYQVTWTATQGGSYALKAVARDNGGATAASSSRTVSVMGGPMPTRAVFNPSPDHSTVTRYVLDIFAAGTSWVGVPIARRDLGKPAVVNGECNVDIASTISGLPGGAYFATVVAVSSKGTSARAISELFLR